MRAWADILNDWPTGVLPSYNVSPTQTIPVFTADGGAAMRWSLIPAWSKTEKLKYSTINARIESAADKPTYRHAWKNGQTCLIPALGYYEWRADEGKRRKQPYFVHSADDGPLVLAGLWESWKGSESGELLSCAILTRQPAGHLVRLHHRMPVILRLDQAVTWLQTPHQVADEIASYTPQDIMYYAISTKVNNPRNDNEGLIQPR